MDMYAKCGVVDYTRRIFHGMGRRDLRSWNAVLYIYAIARCMEDGFKLFNEMLGSGFSLNMVTFDALVSENYVVLLKIYENAGLWEGVKMVREMMEKHGIKKEVGCSWIEIKSRFHTFVAGGDPELGSSEEYQKLWSEFKEAMRGIGIMKNLCVCADCHSWMKTVSQVLREMKHFRHFEKGSCSCKDYW
ncbi:hypothetical protein RHMOL_Rhmol10G0268400 [Rhododendron molle]|uniref:Uncharacterized protein n=1 Tax=Rhododendron molle TaxID=49168 RepID=A0ACC0M8C3_RHOML|nr:hypothetical protein RHMOL_Rhmol10G0268400 [Rhododendron molle]